MLMDEITTTKEEIERTAKKLNIPEEQAEKYILLERTIAIKFTRIINEELKKAKKENMNFALFELASINASASILVYKLALGTKIGTIKKEHIDATLGQIKEEYLERLKENDETTETRGKY